MSQALTGAAIWVLITVTNGGTVHQKTGFRDQAICEDALSISLYGRTRTEHEADARAQEAAEKKHEAEWRAKHPPREPKTELEKQAVKHGDHQWSYNRWSGTDGCGHIKDGLIYDDDCAWTNGYLSTYSKPDPDSIKYARCLPDPRIPLGGSGK